MMIVPPALHGACNYETKACGDTRHAPLSLDRVKTIKYDKPVARQRSKQTPTPTHAHER